MVRKDQVKLVIYYMIIAVRSLLLVSNFTKNMKENFFNPGFKVVCENSQLVAKVRNENPRHSVINALTEQGVIAMVSRKPESLAPNHHPVSPPPPVPHVIYDNQSRASRR